MTTILTIPKNLAKKDLVVIDKKVWETLSKENDELRQAMKAVVAGEKALQGGRTRSFREFLKAEFPRYAKNY
ncbi:MAG: hypothetical protein Q8P55_00280 [bacterium]|nr:hypothetical protein [bacterium]